MADETLYDEIRLRIDAVVQEWVAASDDGTLTAREVGMIVVHAAQALFWATQSAMNDPDALKLAATRLYDEVLVRVLEGKITEGFGSWPWFLRPLKFVAPWVLEMLAARMRTKWIELIEGVLQAFNNVVTDERQEAITAAHQMANRPSAEVLEHLSRRRERRMSVNAVKWGV